MLHQIEYQFRNRPSLEDVEALKRIWLNGGGDSGVRPLRWFACRGSDTRTAAKTGRCGTPGIVKLYGSSSQLLLDFDSGRCPALERMFRLFHFLDLRPLYIRMDRTRRGWHWIIQLRSFCFPLETVALQMALGSDLKRETYNLVRVMSGNAGNGKWNLLFEEKLK